MVEDGQLLNTRYGYPEIFGFQLMRGKPFYFFRKDERFGVSYDGQSSILGYNSIPHYGCCSAAELNPRPRENMVSFFARQRDVWFYVEE